MTSAILKLIVKQATHRWARLLINSTKSAKLREQFLSYSTFANGARQSLGHGELKQEAQAGVLRVMLVKTG